MCFTLLTFLLPLQLLRGDYGGLPNATERAEQILSDDSDVPMSDEMGSESSADSELV